MGNVLSRLSLFLFGLFISFLFYVYFGGSNISDLVVAKSIPQYPNASKWEASASLNLPDGRPSGLVKFATDDIPQSVYDFYQSEFEKKGWKFEQIRMSQKISGVIRHEFSKQIGNQRYSISLHQRDSIFKKSTDNWWNWWMSINHDR